MGSYAHKLPCKCSVLDASGKPITTKEDCPLCDGKGKAYMNANGVRTGGLFQVFNQITKSLLNKATPILVFDPPKEQLDRTGLLDSYKGNRKECPEWITYQMDWGENNLQFIESVECYTSDNHESDDVIATKAIQLAEAGHDVTICADDKDFFPTLKWDRIKLFRQKNIFTRQDFYNKFGFPVERWEEYLAIIGDTADNYNLIKGLGDKAACDIIANYMNLDDFVADKGKRCNTRTQSAIKKLVDNLGEDKFAEEISRSLQLAKLNTKVDYKQLNPEPNREFIADELRRFGLYHAFNKLDLMFPGGTE